MYHEKAVLILTGACNAHTGGGRDNIGQPPTGGQGICLRPNRIDFFGLTAEQ